MTRRHKSTSSVSTLQILFAVVALLVVLISIALMLAPKKPKAPPPSAMSYAERPKERSVEAPREKRAVQAPSTPKPATPEPPAPPEEPEEEAREFVMTGRVTDSRTRAPVYKARVRAQREWTAAEERGWQERNKAMIAARDGKELDALREEEKGLRLSAHTWTNEGGEFEIRISQGGDYHIEVLRAGYLPGKAEVEGLGKNGTERVVNIALSVGAEILGRVTESGSSIGAKDLFIRLEPIEVDKGNYHLAMYNRRENRCTTDDDGHYSLGGLVPGEYAVSVDVSQSPYKIGKVMPYQKVIISHPDQQVRGVDFEVDAAGVVWGYVVTPEGDPIDGAEVLLCTSDSVLSQALSAMVHRAPPAHDRSEADGYYELLGVPLNEEWRVYAMSKDHSPQLADPFLLTNSKRSVRIDIFLFGGTTVYGWVVDPQGGPIANADVLCIPGFTSLLSPMDNPQAFRDGRANEFGEFELKDLPAGSYQIFARQDGYKLSAMGEPVYPNGYTDITNVQIVLYPVDEGDHAIFGIVTDAAGAPLDGVHVRVEGFGTESLSNVNWETTTDGNGEFRIDGVELGMYGLIVDKPGYGHKTLTRVLLDKPNSIILEASAVVRGMVVVRDTGRPPEGACTVSAAPLPGLGGGAMSLARLMDDPSTRSVQTADGHFELYLAAGAYRLEAASGDLTPGRAEILLEPGQVLEGITLYLTRTGGTIEGRVTTADGKSPQGALVMLIEAESSAESMVMLAVGEGAGLQSTRVGADGHFMFTNLPSSTYNVIVQHEVYATAESGPVFLEPQGSVPGITVRLGAGGALEGYVYEAGQPVAGAIVMVIGSGTTETATTENNGHYYIEGLAGGTYQVVVSSASMSNITAVYGTRGDQVIIEDGRTTRHDFGAGVGVRLEGRCDPPPATLLGGRVLVRRPGPPLVSLGEMVAITQLSGQSSGIDPSGIFSLEDIEPGEWQLDIYYFEATPLEIRYMHTELVVVTGEEDVIPLEVIIQ